MYGSWGSAGLLLLNLSMLQQRSVFSSSFSLSPCLVFTYIISVVGVWLFGPLVSILATLSIVFRCIEQYGWFDSSSACVIIAIIYNGTKKHFFVKCSTNFTKMPRTTVSTWPHNPSEIFSIYNGRVANSHRGVKNLFLKRHYQRCSARSIQILDNVKNPGTPLARNFVPANGEVSIKFSPSS
jgi:hypothetical protein